MQSHLQGLITYFSGHPGLALALIFAAAVLEALAVIGTVIPGSTVVFVGGTLIGEGRGASSIFTGRFLGPLRAIVPPACRTCPS